MHGSQRKGSYKSSCALQGQETFHIQELFTQSLQAEEVRSSCEQYRRKYFCSKSDIVPNPKMPLCTIILGAEKMLQRKRCKKSFTSQTSYVSKYGSKVTG